MDPEFLSVAEVARLFHCHPETVKRRARRHELPAFKFGRRWFFPRAELSRWINDELFSKCHLRRDEETACP